LESLKGGDQSEDLGVDGRIIMKQIHLARDRDRWRALVNAVINSSVA
jgi:hypothetical protein